MHKLSYMQNSLEKSTVENNEIIFQYKKRMQSFF
jgi:hypothetical protein